MPIPLGELLVQENLISPQQLQEAREYQNQHGGKLRYNLIELGFVEDEEITAFISRRYGVPSIDLSQVDVDPSLIKLLPAEAAQKYQMFPVSREGASLTIAMVDPSNVFAMNDIKVMTGCSIEPVVASETAIMEAIEKYYGSMHSGQIVVDEVEDIDLAELERSDEPPVVKLCNLILTDALRRGAREIHIEPFERELQIRFRIDGVLYVIMNPPLRLRDAMISRFKIMAKLNFSEKKLPQRGEIYIRMNSGGKVRELRLDLSTQATLFGEMLTLRLVDKENLILDITKLGLEQKALERFEHALSRPKGMVLVTGPRRSGRTTTLYAAVSKLNTSEKAIMTVEASVEYDLIGVNQKWWNDRLDFSSALRAVLKQRPDVVMVDRIEDGKVAEIALNAARRHLLLCALDVRDTASAIHRLIDLTSSETFGRFLAAKPPVLVVNQRLVRRLCDRCRVPIEIAPQFLVDFGFSEDEANRLKLPGSWGCGSCENTGYKGWIGLYEVMELDDEIRALVEDGASERDLRRKAVQNGMSTLRQTGLQKIREGVTTVTEVTMQTPGDVAAGR